MYEPEFLEPTNEELTESLSIDIQREIAISNTSIQFREPCLDCYKMDYLKSLNGSSDLMKGVEIGIAFAIQAATRDCAMEFLDHVILYNKLSDFNI